MTEKISNSFKKKLAAAEQKAAYAQKRESRFAGEIAMLKAEIKKLKGQIELLKEALTLGCASDPNLVELALKEARESLGLN